VIEKPKSFANYRLRDRARLILVAGGSAVGVLIAVLFPSCCGPVSESSIPGTYVADYKDAYVTLKLLAGGEYVQFATFRSSQRILQVRGSWVYHELSASIFFNGEFLKGNLGNSYVAKSRGEVFPVFRAYWRILIQSGAEDGGVSYWKQNQ
jgi:hypothetical protein